jgi:hypothetical protein
VNDEAATSRRRRCDAVELKALGLEAVGAIDLEASALVAPDVEQPAIAAPAVEADIAVEREPQAIGQPRMQQTAQAEIGSSRAFAEVVVLLVELVELVLGRAR